VSWPRPVAGHVWQFGLVTAVPGATARMTGRCPFRPPWPGQGYPATECESASDTAAITRME